MTGTQPFLNPFRPGAGHPPPYLAGRDRETEEFCRLLRQPVILENPILTGLRGVGKTVLLETFPPLARREGWWWVGTDLSESAGVSEHALAIRLLTDLAVVTSAVVVERRELAHIGFTQTPKTEEIRLNYQCLAELYDRQPGLVSDKLKMILELVWPYLKRQGVRGVVFSYDEAQTLSDQSNKEQYPLSVLLDVFQSLQKKGFPLLLCLTGLPTLFPKLVEARTYTERMFHVITLTRLNEEESRKAILRPFDDRSSSPVRFTDDSVQSIVNLSQGYPYFIQFICREVFDAFLAREAVGGSLIIPIHEITRKLDTDFFAGRWARATDRQRDLLRAIAELPDADEEFTVQEAATSSRRCLAKGFSSSHVNQMLAALVEAGLVYKNRHGKYAFAVPLLGQFIRRRIAEEGAGT